MTHAEMVDDLIRREAYTINRQQLARRQAHSFNRRTPLNAVKFYVLGLLFTVALFYLSRGGI